MPQLRLCTVGSSAYEVNLADYDAVFEATQAAHQLVARTEISNAETGLRAVLEYVCHPTAAHNSALLRTVVKYLKYSS